MQLSSTALILIGYQNDYFSEQGILYPVIEASAKTVLANTVQLLDKLIATDLFLITTPIFFTADYSELVNPIGILKSIQDMGAFKRGAPGSAVIEEISGYGSRIVTVEGKRGLNAFHGTELENQLRQRGISDVILAGVVTSICIDSTARSAFEKGFNVHVLSDCTGGRTEYEQDFYCNEVLPLYSRVVTSQQVLKSLNLI